MVYQHDIFLSYNHDEQMGNWVHEHLKPFMISFVGNAINRPVDIFIDREGIATGESWPLRLRNALAHSRCLVAVWSPLYFHSEWCRKECETILRRETQYDYRTASNPSGLVIPINVFDGEFFPDKVKNIQWLDCKKHWVIGDGFAKTERYIEFQDLLRNWAIDVAKIITEAPPWEENWLSEDWQDVPDDELLPKTTLNFQFAGLE
jgi:hypothetical protein